MQRKIKSGMRMYKSPKVVKAMPMLLGDFYRLLYKGVGFLSTSFRDLEKAAYIKPGYLVGYPGSDGETFGFDGECEGRASYVSWIDKEDFEGIYKLMDEKD